MCFSPCKKYKKKIENLRSAVKKYDSALNESYKKCEEKDKQIREWKRKYSKLKEKYNNLKKEYEEECKESPNNKAIKSLKIQNGRFVVNGKPTKLIGVSMRGMLACGCGQLPDPRYEYLIVKNQILKSKCNYIRVLIPKNISFARKEIIDYLNHGIVVEVELFDAGKPDRTYQADWKDAFNSLKDLPVFFDAHNEFTDYYCVNEVISIINYVTSHGGLIGAGAWGSSTHGKEYSRELKTATDKYQIVTHHRQWTKQSIDADREAGKPIVLNEIHTRDLNLAQIKQAMKDGYNWCDGVQVYSLLNFGMGQGSNFQKLLNYAGEIK